MKKTMYAFTRKIALILALALLPCSTLYAATETNGNTQSAAMPNIHLAFAEQEVVIEMLDNPASRDFISLLPLTLEFGDFAGAEKIARNLPRRLDTSNSPTCQEEKVDFTYYAPWGNLAVFYNSVGTDSQLYALGRIVSGKEHLAKMDANFTGTIEIYSPETK